MHRPPAFVQSESRRGAAAVELAVLLPLLCFILFASLDFCRVFYYSVTVSNCARNGAAYGSTDQARARDPVGIEAAALADARSNLDTQYLNVSCSTDDTASYVQVTVDYPFITLIPYPAIPRQTNLSRTVRMDVVPATPVFN
jgi:Flp pilus assembly protein TadG